MASYKLSGDAKADLKRIHQHGVEMFGEEQADKYVLAFRKRFEEISQWPFANPAVDNFRDGYRRCVCGVDSIYYRIDGDDVEIMAIVGRQDLDNIL